MQKLASDFEKMTVITKQERAVLGNLKDFVLNPETGEAIGLLVVVPKAKKKIMVVNKYDISGVGTNFLMIDSVNNLSEPDEIIRIKEVLDLDIELIGSKVVDEDGKNIGRVRDWSINLKAMHLERLYVTASVFVKMISRELLIPSESIVKIEKDKVIVKSGSVKSGKKITSVVEAKPVRPKVAQ